MADPPSQISSAGLVIGPATAAVRLAASRRANTASLVAPVRSRATITGICSTDSPRLLALPPRLRDFLGRSDRFPLKDSSMNVSSASTKPDKVVGLSRFNATRKRWRQRNAVLGCTSHRFAARANDSPLIRADA